MLFAIALFTVTLGDPVAPADAVLRWDAPAGCPTEADVVASIEALLGDPLTPDRTELRVDARVTSGPDGQWMLELHERSSTGERDRSIRAESCVALAEAAALLVSVSVDPSIGMLAPPVEEQPAVVEPPAAPAPVVVIPATAATPAAPAPARATRLWHGTVRATAGVAVQPLPRVGPGLAGAIGARTRRVRLELVGAYWFARRVHLDGDSDRGGELRLWWLGARGCGVPSVGRVELPVCGAVQLGAMRGIGVGVARPVSARVLWVALAAGPGLEVRIVGPLSFAIDLDLVVPLMQGRFVLDALGTVHKTGPVAMTALAGFAVRWP